MRIKKWLLMFISGLLIFGSFSTTVLSNEKSDEENAEINIDTGQYSFKDEVIYGNLDANGQTKNLYVVNSFEITTPGKITDYGNYTNIRNLTNLSDIEQIDDNQVSFQVEDEEEFYYQGELEDQPLPWEISVIYLLDGKEVAPDELAGQSGKLEIQITTAANDSVDPVFFENYLLQISLTLDPLVFDDIHAPKGTEANEGKNKQIAFNVMPDQEEELIISANVTDFEMDPMNIAAVPANIAIDTPELGDMTEDMQTLSDAIRDINDGVSKLSEGISELNTGTSELGSGSSEYRSGMNELNQSSEDLVNGSKEIRDALNQVSKGLQASPEMPDLSDIQELPDGLRKITGELGNLVKGINKLKEDYGLAYKALDEAIEMIPDSNLSNEQIQKLFESNADTNVIKQLVETYSGAQAVKRTYSAVRNGLKEVPSGLDQISKGTQEIAGPLEAIADEIEGGLKNIGELDALEEFAEGLTRLSSEYQTFHNGLVEYTNGVNLLSTSYQDLDTGIQELSNGVSSLDSGVGELHEGTKELHEETSDMPDEIQSELDELMEEYDHSDFQPVSFVSDRNKNVEIVQFVLQTEKIEMKEPEALEEDTEKDKSLWDRFLDLFR